MMRLSLPCLAAAVLTLLGFAVGQQQMPDCAAQCLVTSLEAQDVCAPTNMTCICTDPALNLAIQGCVAQACTMKQTLVALNVTETTCLRPVRDNTHLVTIVAAVTGGAALVLVLLRLYTSIAGHQFGLDDTCAAAAGVVLIVINTITLFLGPAGIGRDIWYLTPEQIYHAIKLLFFCQLLVWPLSALTKLTFLFFYLRIFPHQHVRCTVFVLMGLIFCWFLAFEIANIFNCTPISFFWNGWDLEHPGHCIDRNTYIYVGAAINITIDVTIIVLPLTELYKLQMNFKKKIAIMAMFSVGIFTTIVAVIRLVKLKQYAKTTNPTMELVEPDIWTMVELNFGIFCACMPSIRHFITNHFPDCFDTNADSDEFNPNGRPSNSYTSSQSGGRTPKKKLGNFSGITKTVDTTVQTMEDEVELVQYGGRKHPEPNSTNETEKDESWQRT